MSDVTVYFKQGMTTVKTIFNFSRNTFSSMELVRHELDANFVTFYRGIKISTSALAELEQQFSKEFKEEIFIKIRTMGLMGSLTRNSKSGAHASPESINNFYK